MNRETRLFVWSFFWLLIGSFIAYVYFEDIFIKGEFNYRAFLSWWKVFIIALGVKTVVKSIRDINKVI